MRALPLWVLLAAGTARAATPCFLIPAPGADVQAIEGPVTKATLSKNCEALVVKAGSVRAVYTDTDGNPHTPQVAAGERFSVKNASQAGQSYDDVQLNLEGKWRGGATPAMAHRYDPQTAQAREFNIPFKEVHVPAAGLTFALTGADASARYQVLDETGKRVVVAGQAGAAVQLARAQLTPGGRYVFQLQLPGKQVSSSFSLVTTDIQRTVDEGLTRIDAMPGLDAATRAIARGLLYEEQSLSFNGMLAMRGTLK